MRFFAFVKHDLMGNRVQNLRYHALARFFNTAKIRPLKKLIHHAGWLATSSLAYHPRRHPRNRCLRRNILEHNAARCDTRTIADVDITENFRTCAYHDTPANLRVTVACVLAASAKCDIVQKRAAVADFSRLSDHDARSVVEHDPTSNRCRWMDVDAKHARRLALQIKREILAPKMPKEVGKALRFKRMKSFEIQKRIDKPAAGGIAVGNGEEGGPKRPAEFRVVFDHARKR